MWGKIWKEILVFSSPPLFASGFSKIIKEARRIGEDYHSFARTVACSRLQDSGEKSFSKRVKKKCQKRAVAFPNRARLIFALLVLIRPYYTIWETGTGYANCDVASILPRKLIPGRAEYLYKEKECKDVSRVTKYERDYWRGVGRNNHVFLSECAWLISVLVCTMPKRRSPQNTLSFYRDLSSVIGRNIYDTQIFLSTLRKG